MIAKVRVLSNRRETPTVHTVRFKRPEGFAFAPVQFCGLELETGEGGIEHTMSLASSPTRPYLEFGARVASGSPWKRAFAALRPGDVAEVDGAYGHFVLDETRPAVLVAGGIGVTPLRGMAQYAADTKMPHDVVLLYGNRDETEIAYREELDDLARANPRFRVIHTLSRAAPSWPGRRGRIDAALAREVAAGMADPAYYVCGVPQMVVDMVRALLDDGVARERIVHERFMGYD